MIDQSVDQLTSWNWPVNITGHFAGGYWLHECSLCKLVKNLDTKIEACTAEAYFRESNILHKSDITGNFGCLSDFSEQCRHSLCIYFFVCRQLR